MTKIAIVTPTCRPESYYKFREAWEGRTGRVEWIVVQDAQDATIDGAADWTMIKDDLGDVAPIISRQDSAVRSYGYLLAWRRNVDLVITLDDDCYPGETEDLAQEHLDAMTPPSYRSTIDGVRVRGLPYSDPPPLQTMVNIGLWSKVLDYDAITQIGSDPGFAGELPSGISVVPKRPNSDRRTQGPSG